MGLTHGQLVELRDKMVEHLNDSELRSLCFELEEDYENLEGAGKAGRILSLVQKCARLDSIAALLAALARLRPKVAWPGAGPPPASKIVVLFLAANPRGTDALRLGEEVRDIDERLQLAKFRDRFELEQMHAARSRDIAAALLRFQPQVVHFSGHGSQAGDLVFEDEAGESKPVSAKALGSVFRALKDNVRCVVLNACWSNAQASAIARDVDCVVGMSRSISDKAAIGFAAAFYQGLAFGRSVQVAFDLGKAEIGLGGLPETATPRLKTRKGLDAAKVVLV